VIAILLLALVVGYSQAVNDHGDEKVAQFWGNKAQLRYDPQREVPVPQQPVTRFGHTFGRGER